MIKNLSNLVRIRLPLVLLSALVCTNIAVAQVTDQKQVKASSSGEQKAAAQNLVNRLSLMSNLSGKFEQKITDESNEELQKTQGEFVLKRPGNLWWNTAPPFEQLVVSNGEKLWVYDPDLEQVTIYPKEKVQSGPASILNGSLNSIRARYQINERLETIKKGSSKVTSTVFTLVPNNQKIASFDKVVLAFSDQRIQQVSMTDKLGQTTFIDFFESSQNKEIKDELFDFVPPEGTDIVVDGE